MGLKIKIYDKAKNKIGTSIQKQYFNGFIQNLSSIQSNEFTTFKWSVDSVDLFIYFFSFSFYIKKNTLTI